MTTVSYMLAGQFAHEDFAGNKGDSPWPSWRCTPWLTFLSVGLLNPGDLQFMVRPFLSPKLARR